MIEQSKNNKSKKPFYYDSKQDVFNKTQKLRREGTPAEILFWKVVRNNKIEGFKFRRQHPVSNFIVDFYCHEALLVIELDGDVHEVEEVKEHDRLRERVLVEQGLTVLRFTNEQVLSDVGKVIDKIKEYLKSPHPTFSKTSPYPLLQGEGKATSSAIKYKELEKPKALFCWSGGKDSAFALYKILQEKEYVVTNLLTTINENYRRVSMHGVREELIEEQAESIGIPLLKVYVKEGSNEEYERKMEAFLLEQKANGVEYVIFGDIFLDDLRAYRDKNLEEVGMKGVYPLWKKDTSQLANDFINLGFKTMLCCTNDAYLGEKEVGELFTFDFLAKLPENVDPCGENGEFHSFCFDGPIFKHSLKIKAGEKVYKPLEIKTDSMDLSENKTQGFWFCELNNDLVNYK